MFDSLLNELGVRDMRKIDIWCNDDIFTFRALVLLLFRLFRSNESSKIENTGRKYDAGRKDWRKSEIKI